MTLLYKEITIMRGQSRTPQSDKRKYPLRKVVDRSIPVILNEKTYTYDEIEYQPGCVFANRLECGHLVRPAQDFYGEITSVKQRCRYCHKESLSQKTQP